MDRENSSFFFNLNDQFVLDAYRKSDKLKFANHSPDPNCYSKVIMAAGVTELVYLPKNEFVKERNSSMIIIMSQMQVQMQHLPGKEEDLLYDYHYHLFLRKSFLLLQVPYFSIGSFFCQQAYHLH